MAINIHKLLRSNKASFLCLDQGLTHGPKVFDAYSIDPEHVLRIALESEMTGVVLTPGLAEKYYHTIYTDIPLIIKINGSSALGMFNPNNTQFCSVDHAVRLGADAIGFSIFEGNAASAQMIADFGRVVEQAHEYGLPVIVWLYPRGENIHEHDTDTIAYAARIALELGADFVKIKHPHDPAGLPWIVQSAGKCKVLGADPELESDTELLTYTKALVDSGACGVAFGRSVWQHPKPFALIRALHGIIFHDRSIQDVQKHLE